MNRNIRWTGAAMAAGLAVTALAGTAAAQGRDTIKLAVWNMSPSLGNPHGGFARPYSYFWPAMFDALTQLDEKGNAAPMLAERWESADGKTWRFTLKQGVKYHNGETFDANAVKTAVDWLLSDEGKKMQLAGEINTLAGATVISPSVIEIQLKEVNALFANQTSALRVPAPRHWTEMGMAAAARQPQGTGPFRVTEWGTNDVKMVAFPDAMRKAKAKAFDIVIVTESPGRVQGLLSDQIDIALNIGAESLPQVTAAGHQVIASPGTGVRTMVMRALDDGKPLTPFADKRVRQAINYGVDRAAINEGIFAGKSGLVGQPATPTAFGFNPNVKAFPYDPAKARALLAEAGFPTGFKAKAEVLNTSQQYLTAYQQIAADLAKIGVQMEMVSMTIPDLVGKLTKSRAWEGTAFDFDFETLPAADALRLKTWHSCFNRFTPWHCFPEVQAKLEAALTEPDLEKRRARTMEMMEIYHDNPPGLYLLSENDIDGVHKRIKGYRVVQRHVQYQDLEIR